MGASDGANLRLLQSYREVDAHGIDPSQEAVNDGSLGGTAIDLRCGTSDDLPYEANSFDMVFFGFCLYLVDRHLLFETVAEADRVLKNGGILAILDFDPGFALRRPYHHSEGLWSYKMDYSRLFLANPAYIQIEKIALTHAGEGWHPEPQERLSLWTLRKNEAEAYRQ